MHHISLLSLSLSLLSLPLLTTAHTRFTTLFINSKTQGDGTCIRMDMNPSTTTDFISSLSSPDMSCGVQGSTLVNRTCPLNPGDSISLLHRLYTDASQPGSIDPSHKGSTAIYMKRLADITSSDPWAGETSGDGWFKIAWNGYDVDTKQWGTEKMIANNGLVDATIPKDLPGGYYLVRSEVLALQNIVDGKVAPQFYAGCAQVFVDSAQNGDINGNVQTVSIPGYVDEETPALSYDIYGDVPPAVPYVEFGPGVYGGGNGSDGSGSVSARDVGGMFVRSPRGRWYGYGSRRPTYNNVADVWEPTSDSNSDFDGSDADGTATAAAATATAAASATATDTFTSTGGPSTASPSSNSRSSTSTPSTPQSTATSSSSSSSSSPSSTASIIGLCPSNTVLTVANQCLTEIPSWTSDTPGSLPKCWAASQQCWDTLNTCWNNLSPAINADDMDIGCHAWEGKCNALVDWCNGGNLEGPPAWSGGNVDGSGNGKVRKREVGRGARRVGAVRRSG